MFEFPPLVLLLLLLLLLLLIRLITKYWDITVTGHLLTMWVVKCILKLSLLGSSRQSRHVSDLLWLILHGVLQRTHAPLQLCIVAPLLCLPSVSLQIAIWSDNTEWCMGVTNNYTCHCQLYRLVPVFLHLSSNFIQLVLVFLHLFNSVPFYLFKTRPSKVAAICPYAIQ